MGPLASARLLDDLHRDLDSFERVVPAIALLGNNFVSDFQPLDYFPKDRVFPVQVGVSFTTMKNCEPALSGSWERAIETAPRTWGGR